MAPSVAVLRDATTRPFCCTCRGKFRKFLFFYGHREYTHSHVPTLYVLVYLYYTNEMFVYVCVSKDAMSRTTTKYCIATCKYSSVRGNQRSAYVRGVSLLYEFFRFELHCCWHPLLAIRNWWVSLSSYSAGKINSFHCRRSIKSDILPRFYESIKIK